MALIVSDAAAFVKRIFCYIQLRFYYLEISEKQKFAKKAKKNAEGAGRLAETLCLRRRVSGEVK